MRYLKNLKITKILMIFSLCFVTGCNPPKTDDTTNPNNTNGTIIEGYNDCVLLSNNVAITPAGSCPGTSGTWNFYSINQDSNAAQQSCGLADTSRPIDQATFDNPGPGSAPATSNHDYIYSAKCSSGSTEYTNGVGPITRTLYIWQKVP